MFRGCNRTPKSAISVHAPPFVMKISKYEPEEVSSSFKSQNSKNEHGKVKFSLEQELEILEMLEKGDFDRTVGTEQWNPQFKQKSLSARPNLMHLHEMFGSVPVDLGKSLLTKSKLFRGITFSESELNLTTADDKNRNNRKNIFEETAPISKIINDSPGVYSPSPSNNSDADFGVESFNDFAACDDGFRKVYYELLNAMKLQKETRNKLSTLKKMENSRTTRFYEEWEELANKMEDIISSLGKLKIKDRIGALDVNKLMQSPVFGKSTHFIPCPAEKHHEAVNGLSNLHTLAKEISVLQKKIDQFAAEGHYENYDYLEKTLEELQQLVLDEEKNNQEWMEILQWKVKLFHTEKSNDDYSNGFDNSCVSESKLEDETTEICSLEKTF